jgi:demethoxyubiquinone hydroxylase (CLK1/Coq7/Cat5 family)
MWELIDERPILEKFQLATVLKKKPRMNKGTPIYQNAVTLIHMRNALIHFKPEWPEEKDVHKKIERQIESKFPLSPFFQGNSIFPEKCMSHGCAEWSVQVALAFVEAFTTETGIENRYRKHLDKIRLFGSDKPIG